MNRAATLSASKKRKLIRALQEAAKLQRQGRLAKAANAYRAVLAQAPNIPEAHHNLGLVYRTEGDQVAAEQAFRRALELQPGYALAHHNLAVCLAQQGRPTEALEHALDAVRCKPGEAGYRRGLAALLPFSRLPADARQSKAILEQCYRDDGIEHQLLVPTTLDLLRRQPAVSAALDRAARGGEITDPILSGCANDRLLALLLPRAVVAGEDFERLLTGLRAKLLRRHRSLADTNETEGAPLAFAAALACQCFLVDYAYAETAEETAAVESLAQRLAVLPAGAAPPWPDLVHLALYRPLAGYRWAAEAAASDQADGDTLVPFQQRLLRAPLREAQLAASLPTMALRADSVSTAVQQQYEEHPYPRWLTTRDRPARPLAQVVAGLFPHATPLPPPDRPISVLVAGCGSGKHAIDVATRFSNATILAVDLSRRSLAYAKREAEARDLTNLTFVQADILALDDIEQRFDLVESVGVLHHLQDPLHGWRLLAALLKPQGFMRIGLYSRRGRKAIDQARAFVAQSGFPVNSDGIRRARQAIFALPRDQAARQVTRELDFYSLTGCRDLLFNVQEQAFTLPGIGNVLQSLGLLFLGFELHDPAVQAAYAKRFPDDPSMAVLANWERLEGDAPALFGRMYQFWCRQP